MKGFTKDQRSTFKYWFAHWCAFNMTALVYHVWRPKYLLHDIEKPWLLLWYKMLHRFKPEWYSDPYAWTQSWHRRHNNHHIEYLGKLDIDAMLIDWECSRFTKQNNPLPALGEINKLFEQGKYLNGMRVELLCHLNSLGIIDDGTYCEQLTLYNHCMSYSSYKNPTEWEKV